MTLQSHAEGTRQPNAMTCCGEVARRVKLQGWSGREAFFAESQEQGGDIAVNVCGLLLSAKGAPEDCVLEHGWREVPCSIRD